MGPVKIKEKTVKVADGWSTLSRRSDERESVDNDESVR